MSKLRRGIMAMAVALMLAPAAALAHPGVYTVAAKIAKTAAKQTVGDDATGGTWKPSAGASAVPFDATAAEVQSALDADPAIGFDNVHASGPEVAGTQRTYALEFVGTLAGAAVATVAPDGTGLTGGGSPKVSAASTQTGGAEVTYPANPATMANQDQTIVSSDGYAIGFRETNGVGPGGGILNLKELPSGYRKPMSSLQKLEFAGAQTSIQLHATCSGVAALSNPENILKAWHVEERSDKDPFYDYIPWQASSAGLGDEPSLWIPVVKELTGVDLSALSSEEEFKAACTGKGGTYHKADTASNVTTAVVADAVEAATTPLNAQITDLTSQIAGFTGQVAALGSQVDAITGEKNALAATNASLSASNAALQAQAAQHPAAIDRPLRVTLAGRKLSVKETFVMVTGTAGETAKLEVQVSAAAAKALHLKSRTIASTTKKLDDQGAGLALLGVAKATRKALAKVRGSQPVTVTASSAPGRQASATATLSN